MVRTGAMWWIFAIWVPSVVPGCLLLFSMRNRDRKGADRGAQGGRKQVRSMARGKRAGEIATRKKARLIRQAIMRD